jgi:Zn-dependent protease
MDFGRRRGLTVGVSRSAFRPSGIFLGILALFVVSGILIWNRIGSVGFDVFLFVTAGWLLSLCLHEYAHALTAYRSGDTSVATRGYLTLNPLLYTNWLLSLALPLLFLIMGGFGLPGGAVWVDHGMIRGKARETLISLAGPGINVLFTLLTIAPFWFGLDTFAHVEFWEALAFLAFLQLTASVLNLLPIPGVDGGNAVRPRLNYEWRRGFDVVAPWGLFIFIALLFNPTIRDGFFSFVFWIGDLIGFPRDLYPYGWSLFRFWS